MADTSTSACVTAAPKQVVATKLRITRDPAKWFMVYLLLVAGAFAAYSAFILPSDGFGFLKVMLLLLAPAWLIVMWMFLFGMEMNNNKAGERACAN